MLCLKKVQPTFAIYKWSLLTIEQWDDAEDIILDGKKVKTTKTPEYGRFTIIYEEINKKLPHEFDNLLVRDEITGITRMIKKDMDVLNSEYMARVNRITGDVIINFWEDAIKRGYETIYKDKLFRNPNIFGYFEFISCSGMIICINTMDMR